jgi:hypothetical protein
MARNSSRQQQQDCSSTSTRMRQASNLASQRTLRHQPLQLPGGLHLQRPERCCCCCCRQLA